MLGDANVQPMLPVNDLKKAEKFYEETLGLKRLHEEPGVAVTYQSGNATLNVYRSEFAGTNKGTAGRVGGRRCRGGRQATEVPRGDIRALRPARPDARRRHPSRGRLPGRVVERPVRQHPLRPEPIRGIQEPLTISRLTQADSAAPRAGRGTPGDCSNLSGILSLAAGVRLGPYEIVSPLGTGGMGEVYRARDSRLGRDVALKVLPADLSRDPDRLKRFEQEARSASALNHPGIVTVYDVGKSGTTSYIAMELVEGRTLRDLLSEGALQTKKLIGIAAQLADGLAKAHGAGIVHRDLKPENVMVTPDGYAKILDFGLAKLTKPEDSSGATAAPTVSKVTEPGTVMGTVAYMSPEQALGRPIDFRSDQFSFGSVLFEMLTGKLAFARASSPETMTAVIREEPEPLEIGAPQSPVPLRWIVERCLAKEPDERYASTRDLARDLGRLKDGISEGLGLAPPADPGTVSLPSVAVLPFVNMSADPENEFFADGITEDVIAHLARIGTLRVTSRTSAMAFKKTPTEPPRDRGGARRRRARRWERAPLGQPRADRGAARRPAYR